MGPFNMQVSRTKLRNGHCRGDDEWEIGNESFSLLPVLPRAGWELQVLSAHFACIREYGEVVPWIPLKMARYPS
jgi:hypothetical protein